jgi:hypothetical protein
LDLEAFANEALAHGNPRSQPYRLGVLDALRFRVEGVRIPPHRYAPGTAESDAYHAGIDRGHSLWRTQIREQEPEREWER